jgi:hypothetical protein
MPQETLVPLSLPPERSGSRPKLDSSLVRFYQFVIVGINLEGLPKLELLSLEF